MSHYNQKKVESDSTSLGRNESIILFHYRAQSLYSCTSNTDVKLLPCWQVQFLTRPLHPGTPHINISCMQPGSSSGTPGCCTALLGGLLLILSFSPFPIENKGISIPDRPLWKNVLPVLIVFHYGSNVMAGNSFVMVNQLTQLLIHVFKSQSCSR